jgi:hypothetical protein
MAGNALPLCGGGDCVGRFQERVFEEPAAIQLADG